MAAKMTCPRCGYTWRATLNGWLWHIETCKGGK
jgi:hypothetical protein